MNIILFDDHILFGEGLRKLIIENDQTIERFDYVSTEKNFMNRLRSFSYDVALLDINLKDPSGTTGFDLISKIKSESPTTAVIILSSYDMPLYKEKAFECGASEYLNKSVTPDDLIRCLHRTSAGTSKRDIVHKGTLTKREIEVLREICNGDKKKDVAAKLYMSERTLYNHLQSIYSKLDADNAIDAFNKAIKKGYIDPLM